MYVVQNGNYHFSIKILLRYQVSWIRNELEKQQISNWTETHRFYPESTKNKKIPFQAAWIPRLCTRSLYLEVMNNFSVIWWETWCLTAVKDRGPHIILWNRTVNLKRMKRSNWEKNGTFQGEKISYECKSKSSFGKVLLSSFITSPEFPTNKTPPPCWTTSLKGLCVCWKSESWNKSL